MSTIKQFEDLLVWQKARELNKLIHLFTNNHSFNKDQDLKRQIRRSSLSISSNIAEGFERNGNREFNNFLSIAKGSAGELRSQLYTAIDLKFLNESQFNELSSRSSEISKMLNGFMMYLNQSQHKGTKHKLNKT